MKEPQQQPPEHKKGFFFSIEGPDGSGKTTVASIIYRKLDLTKHRNRRLHSFRDPGSSDLGQAIRELLFNPKIDKPDICSLMLFTAARLSLTKNNIIPALDNGDVVLQDRYIDTTLAYQGYGQKLLHYVRQLRILLKDELVVPNRTYLLNVSLKTARARLQARAGAGQEVDNQYDLAGDEFKMRLREGYHAAYVNEPERFLCIDTDNKTPEEVADIIIADICAYIEKTDNYLI